MLVEIKDYGFLYDHKDEGPSVNESMLGLAGNVFEIEDTYIVPGRYYNYLGWNWLGSWLKPANGTTSTVPEIQAPADALDLRYHFTSHIDEQVFPDGFEYIEIKDPYIKSPETIGWFKLTPSDNYTRVYIKFTNTSAYNVTPYTSLSYDVFGRHEWSSLRAALFSGEPRAREEDAVQVLTVLAQVFREHIVPLFETSYRLYYNGTSFDFVNYDHITTMGRYEASHDIIRNINKSSRFIRHLVRLLNPMQYERLVDYHFVTARDAVVNGTPNIIDLRNLYIRDKVYSGRLRSFEQAPDDVPVYTCEVTGLRFMSDDPDNVFPVLKYMFEEDFCYETGKPIVIPRFDLYTRQALEQYVTPLYERDVFDTDAIGVLYNERYVHPDYYEELMHKYERLADNIDNLTYHSGVLYEYAGRKFHAYDDEGIEDYDYEPGLDFFGNGDLYLGVELEIDKGGENHKNANIINGILGFNHAYAMHDGSLNEGFEIATMPMTLDYHMNMKQRYVDAFKAAVALGYKSHDTSTCGIHIHIDRDFFGVDRRTQSLKASYMALVIERNWADIVKFSRRSYGRMDQWARNKKLSGDIYHSDTEDDVIDKFGNKYVDGDKYVMLNTNHYNTYELRLFRGTLKPTTYMATLQFVDNLARVIKACPNLAKAQQITFNDIINYKRYDELVAYVNSRGIELEGDDI